MAVSEDRGPDDQVQDVIDGQAGGSLTGNPTRAGATKRHMLRDGERWLHDEERRLLDLEAHAAEWVKTTAAGTFWSRLNAVDFMNSSMQFAVLAVLGLFPFVFFVSA